MHRQHIAADAEAVYHLYTIRVDDAATSGLRDRLRAALSAADVGSGVYYPMPLHRQTCFAPYGAADCPTADALAESVLSLPCFPGLAAAEQDRVIDAVLGALR